MNFINRPKGKSNRRGFMRVAAELAKHADKRGDITKRREWAQEWRELATDAEAARAPEYLTWPGRSGNK